MSYGNQTARYLENDILSRPKEWLVPLLYEHLIASLQRASVQIEVGDLEGKADSLSRANAIVLELASTLDHDKGGEIAKNLASIYVFFASEIINVGRTLDRSAIARLVEIASGLHDAWIKAAEQVAPRSRPASLSAARV